MLFPRLTLASIISLAPHKTVGGVYEDMMRSVSMLLPSMLNMIILLKIRERTTISCINFNYSKLASQCFQRYSARIVVKVIKLRVYICERYGKIDFLAYLLTKIKKSRTLFKQCARLKLTVMKRYIFNTINQKYIRANHLQDITLHRMP
jgi:hypothetical protein